MNGLGGKIDCNYKNKSLKRQIHKKVNINVEWTQSSNL